MKSQSRLTGERVQRIAFRKRSRSTMARIFAMEAIATLTRNDPYLTLPRDVRIAARRDRRSRLFAVPRAEPCAAIEVTPPEPQTEPDKEWIERQKAIPLTKAPWFFIVEEIEPQEPTRPTINDVQRAVAKHYNVTRSDLLCARRTWVVVRPRQVAMYLARNLTLKSLPEIGRRFGDRDSTTVLHAVRKITALRDRDPALNEECDALEKQLSA
jgi:hypothetical protein